AATGLYPEVADALARMRRYADARMSGSGGAVYASFDTRAQAEHAAAQLPEIPSVITRSRNIHPLRDLPPA
ncbi:MAG: 4-(cytidine 5'-diphospho)-2-C-methyl-D-erythritol kinase, partial [Gammaproteobacteria bacterium]|nr:4-(cytidine 5'-diphospho)-2-C-methyl-D-erythritol kinase [Gammaproteobacteria bacterium]